jgi:uncharacterized protein YdhG (YjbR/CyaY superfamily)
MSREYVMARPRYESVDDYIAAQPDAVRPLLEEVRAAIRGALPTASEVISYQMPAYRVANRVAVYFAGFKGHYSVYPVNGEVLEAFRDELAPYEVNEKGTVRFPLDRPVPAALIAGIAGLLAARAEAATKSGRAR